MKTRYLLATCVALIAGSVFLAPETVLLGLSQGIAVDLSRALLLGGIATAALAIVAEEREREVYGVSSEKRK